MSGLTIVKQFYKSSEKMNYTKVYDLFTKLLDHMNKCMQTIHMLAW
jgi:hypothetical protein